MIDWHIIHECDLEDGTPTQWCTEIDHDLYGRFVWIDLTATGEYQITVEEGGTFITLAVRKKLYNAKQWVRRHLIRKGK